MTLDWNTHKETDPIEIAPDVQQITEEAPVGSPAATEENVAETGEKVEA